MGRPITVDCGGLPAGKLFFRRLAGQEELSRVFHYDLELESADAAIACASVVGQPLAVHAELPGTHQRHVHGVVSRFAYHGWTNGRAVYRATIQPSLWLLSRRAGCRIFQNQTVPQILKAVLDAYGFPVAPSLSGSYPQREYVVQYRETDLAFVSRLMEDEGIYYFFRHEAGKHTLVLADSPGAHRAQPGYEDVPFYPPEQSQRRERDHVDAWEAFHQLEPTAFSYRDYDFTRPRANLEVKRSGGGKASPELEIYDYPGGYVQTGEGERYARTRLEEAAARQGRCQGAGDALGLAAGALFKLREHPRQDQNREYLIVAAACELSMPEQDSSSAPSQAPIFRVRFTAQESKTPYRPDRTTPRPVVHGPQTARVVGKSGEEIWTDAYGRVKLQFHWDRASPGNEDSSCWVRVAQAWAHGGWGAMHIPRIGEEVVVHFLEGDPDRPIVAGHLYEADHMPPYALPANQTRSGIKSHSTKGGGSDNFNELRFEDRKGDEQLYLQAEKNYDLLVKNDATNTVGHDEKHDVKNDETHTVGHDRHLTVGNDDTIEVKKNRSKTVSGDETAAVVGARTATVDKDETVTVKGNRSLSVSKDHTLDVTQNRSETVGKDAALTVQGGLTESVAKDLSVTVSGARQTRVGKDDGLQVGKALVIDAGKEIVLQSGSARIVLKSNGNILLDGADITIKGSGKITINASADVVVKGSNVKAN